MLGGPLIHYSWCPYKNIEDNVKETHTQGQDSHVMTEAEIVVMQPRIRGHHRKLA